MGCFDSVWVNCRRCDTPIEWQSKAGDCALDNYSIHQLPVEIAGDLANESSSCEKCGTVHTIRVQTFVSVET